MSLFIQTIGLVGMGANIAAFQSNQHKNIMCIKLLSELAFTIQFLLMGAWTGAAMDAISVVRNYIFYRVVKKEKTTSKWIVFFSALMLIIGFITWEGPMSVFAIFGKIMTTISYGMIQPKKIRLFTLPSCLSWMVYNIWYRSIGAILTELFAIISIITAYIRYDAKKKGEKMNTIQLKKEKTSIIAHKGLSGLEPENTMASFIAAGNRSYFGIETDMHRTSDGEFVIIHDDTTERVAEVKLDVEKTTLHELRNLLLKDKNGVISRTDLRIPTLQEYITTCQNYDKKCILELKNKFNQKDIEKIVGIAKSMDYLNQIIFISFDLDNLKILRKLLPGQELQLITGRYSSNIKEVLLANELDLDIEFNSLTKDIIEDLHQCGRKINCWTCDKKEEAEKLIAYGVDYLTTNILE